MTKVRFKTEDLKAGDIICIPGTGGRVPGGREWDWSRLIIYEVTKRLFKTYVLLDLTGGRQPGDLYCFQIIDLDSERWRLVA